jgi:hypothetical protein
VNGLDTAIRDIHGLDPVGFWPPAPGWWLVAVAAVLTAWLLWLTLRFLWRYPFFTWHRDARRRLTALRRLVPTAGGNAIAAELSQLLRRIAVATHGRHACAGLVGGEWLDWLAANDPEGFDWRTAGTPLLALPYAPPGTASDREALGRLIDAALPWTRHRTRGPSWWLLRRASEPGRG